MRTTNKRGENGKKELFRRTGKNGPLCQLPIAKATVSQHLKELKEAGLIQGEIEAPKVRYCINKENWKLAKKMFADFLGQPICKKESCCE